VRNKEHKEELEKPSDESSRTRVTVNQDDLDEDALIFAVLTSVVRNKGKRQKKSRIERFG